MSVEKLLAWNDRQRALVGGWREWREENDLLAAGFASSLLAELPRYRAEAAAALASPTAKAAAEGKTPVEKHEELTQEDNVLIHEMMARACQGAAKAQAEEEMRAVAAAAAEVRAAIEAQARAITEAQARIAAEADTRAAAGAQARAVAEAQTRASMMAAPAPVAAAPKAPTDKETAQWIEDLDKPHPPLELGERGQFTWSGSDERVTAYFASASHVGGSGTDRQKENQDACFVVQGAHSVVWGVLDGHGADNGRLAAQAGCEAFKAWFSEHEAELRSDPQEAMQAAFCAAHDAIRRQILFRSAQIGEPLQPARGGFHVDGSGQPIDGGATATVVALVQGHLLVVANVGDSDALLGGTRADGSVGFEQLCADHTPTSADEFIRVAQLAAEKRGQGDQGWTAPLFAYTVGGGAMGGGAHLEIFAMGDEGALELDADAVRRLEAADAGFKNARGDRPTAVVAPETEAYDECQLGVTRSLGDFYLQHFGVTWEPSVSIVDLHEVAEQLGHVTLIIASDGLWDLWPYKDALMYHLGRPPPTDSGGVLAPLLELVEATRSQGEEIFGESADNITVVTATFAFGEPASQPELVEPVDMLDV